MGVRMKHFNEQISKAKTIAITGHIHPMETVLAVALP